jgi:aspartyl-tRNA synthetase
VARFIDELKRTHSCGALRDTTSTTRSCSSAGSRVAATTAAASSSTCATATASTQVVFDPERSRRRGLPQAERARRRVGLGIRGKVVDRGEGRRNCANAPGHGRRRARRAVEVTVFNKAETPPFEIEDNINTNEEKRLEYRYLDLRRPKLQRNLMMRLEDQPRDAQLLHDNGFLEVETPFLVKYTPGGARNFLVPSRLYPGHFYALAESPQLYKQMLMVAGFERYFQIVRCFRDEDLRIDRQPEFTQIDVEMSFINQDDLFKMIEGLVFRLWKEALGIDLWSATRAALPAPQLRGVHARLRQRQAGHALRLEHVDLTELVVAQAAAASPCWSPSRRSSRTAPTASDLPRRSCKALVVPRARTSRARTSRASRSTAAWAPRASPAPRWRAPTARGCRARSPRWSPTSSAWPINEAVRREGRGPHPLPVRPRGARARP